MRVTKAQMVKTCDQFAADIEKLRKERDEAREEVRDLRAMVDARMRANAALQGDAQRDREALLTAENRIVALEDAIVSLAVRVA